MLGTQYFLAGAGRVKLRDNATNNFLHGCANCGTQVTVRLVRKNTR